MKIDPEDLISTIEASRILLVSEGTVRNLCNSGKLNVVTEVGGKRLLDKKAVELFKAEREGG
ncbi:hypothetical protein LCGC14_2028760 [marine sediment metagenome]|uniref:Helix-turn-helix domain-containing protein n=1 Tax=marine sediment metagenome TaxID=412755 RepID=A0A0F9HSE6_9ZZZZ